MVLEPNMLQFVAWYWFQQLLANISLMSSEEGAWEKKVPIWSNLTPLCKLSNEDKCWKMNPRLLDNSSASTISMCSSRDRTTFRSTCDTHPSSKCKYDVTPPCPCIYFYTISAVAFRTQLYVIAFTCLLFTIQFLLQCLYIIKWHLSIFQRISPMSSCSHQRWRFCSGPIGEQSSRTDGLLINITFLLSVALNLYI